MKRLLLIVSLSFLSGNIFSQAWAPVGTTWYYGKTYFGAPGVGYMKIESIGDTIISGQSCRKLQKNSWVCDGRSPMEYMYEDSGKIFFYDTTRNSFQMLFDSNTNPGSSWVIYPSDSNTDSIMFTVDSVSNVIINSVTLKVIYVSYSNFTIWGPLGLANEFIERIGNTTYMFPWAHGLCDVTWAWPIRCYTDSILGFVDFDTTHACDYSTVGIKELSSENTFSLSPNPTSNSITIKNNQSQELCITIFSFIGEVASRITLMEDAATTVNLSAFPSGVYLVTAQSGKDFVAKKFVKQ
jgi:hypothetical protein